MADWLKAIIALGTIAGGVFGAIKWVKWKFSKSPQDQRNDIAKDVQDEEDYFSKTGRPKG